MGYRCLALVTDAFGGRGGIAQYNRDLLGALAASGAWSAIAVLPRHAAGPVAAPPPIDQRPRRAGRAAYAARALWASLAGPVDLVFCGHLYLVSLAWFIARLRGAKLVVQAHGTEAWPAPSRLRRAAVEAADLVLCVSRHTRSRLLEWASVAPERVLVLPNTMGDEFGPGPAEALRAELGLAGRRVLLTVGRMDARERYKGHDRVLAALPALVANGFDIVAVMIGDGDDRPRLERLAADLGVGERVRLLGEAPREALPDAYRTADLFVMPSTGEGFGIAFLEALASGTPALGLAAGGAADPLADGELGRLAAADNLAAEIAGLLDAPRPDRGALAAATQARFGRGHFQTRAAAAIDRVLTGVSSA